MAMERCTMSVVAIRNMCPCLPTGRGAEHVGVEATQNLGEEIGPGHWSETGGQGTHTCRNSDNAAVPRGMPWKCRGNVTDKGGPVGEAQAPCARTVLKTYV